MRLPEHRLGAAAAAGGGGQGTYPPPASNKPPTKRNTNLSRLPDTNQTQPLGNTSTVRCGPATSFARAAAGFGASGLDAASNPHPSASLAACLWRYNRPLGSSIVGHAKERCGFRPRC